MKVEQLQVARLLQQLQQPGVDAGSAHARESRPGQRPGRRAMDLIDRSFVYQSVCTQTG